MSDWWGGLALFNGALLAVEVTLLYIHPNPVTVFCTVLVAVTNMITAGTYLLNRR